MWHLVTTSHILVTNFLEYVKLVELAMVQMIGSVEDKKCLSIIALMKSKFCNRLTTHLPFVVHMFVQHFYTIHNFPYKKSALNNGVMPMIAIIMMVKVQ
jgi:hypothetical protein